MVKKCGIIKQAVLCSAVTAHQVFVWQKGKGNGVNH